MPMESRQLRTLVCRKDFWAWLVTLALVTAVHLGGDNPLRLLLFRVPLQLTPCFVERISFLIPVIIASCLFGVAGGALTTAFSLLAMTLRVVNGSCRPESALGEIIGVLVLAVFLTWTLSRQRAQQEAQQACLERLGASEKRYRELFESASDAIWLQDDQGRLIEANAACARLTGYERDELVGRSVSRFLPQPVTAGRHETALRRKDGSEIVVEMVVTPLLAGDQAPAWQCIARDVTERQRREEATRLFARQILRAQEEERGRIARELHDSTVQALTTLLEHLEVLASDRETDPEEAVRRICQMQHIASEAVEDVRRFAQNLRPPALDVLGLVASLEDLAADLQRECGIAIEVLALGQVRRLEPEVELALFRIAQEALTNVYRHAHASEAILILWFKERSVRLTIRDDGVGARLPDRLSDLAATGRMGLVGIQERARLLGGVADIRSEPGRGTTVCVELPV